MKLPNSAHTSLPWRIHEVADDFVVEDVWALETPGGPDDFPLLVRQIAGAETGETSGSQGTSGLEEQSWAPRVLWAVRGKVGEVLGLDGPENGIGARVPALRERLPADLLEARDGPSFEGSMFSPLYMLDREWAGEIANRAVHGIMHLGWVPDGRGRYRGQLAVLVKPSGLLGNAYMAAIKPFRLLVIYPSFVRQIERGWRTNEPSPRGGGS